MMDAVIFRKIQTLKLTNMNGFITVNQEIYQYSGMKNATKNTII
jgi:hypothetical protein